LTKDRQPTASRSKDLIYATEVRAGFVPATRREVFARIKVSGKPGP
jgi:hypothetical protein